MAHVHARARVCDAYLFIPARVFLKMCIAYLLHFGRKKKKKKMCACVRGVKLCVRVCSVCHLLRKGAARDLQAHALFASNGLRTHERVHTEE